MRNEERANLARLLDAQLQQQWNHLDETLRAGASPTKGHAEAIERISRLSGLLPKPDSSPRKLDVIVLASLGLTIMVCTLIRLPSTSVDLDVRASGVRIELAGQRSELLIPGELGEILMLSQVRISQAEQMQPAPADKQAMVELRQLGAPADDKNAGGGGATFPVRLQTIEIPANVQVAMDVAMAYALDRRGLRLSSTSTRPAKAQFGEVIEIGSDGTVPPRRAIRPVVVSGRALSMDLFPVDSTQTMTVFRDVRVSAIRFEHLGETSIMGGHVAVRSGSASRIALQPSDRIEISSKTPMLLREITFDRSGLQVGLTAADATSIAVGDEHPRNLMPTLLDWLRFRWPTQMWGTITALMTVWLAARRWWRPGP